MKNILIAALLFLFFVQLKTFGQNTVTTTTKYGVENMELLEIFEFQNIAVQRFDFESAEIEGKYYQLHIKEFRNGKLADTKILFDATETELFQIKQPVFDLKIFTEISADNLKVQLRGPNYSSASKNFKLTNNGSEYITKDFFGSEKTVENPLKDEFPLLAIITPTIHDDGSGSYCEVVQSDIKPEELGTHFKIPHYFLITMVFK
ncbi:hypothetical protein [Sinomicrobium sp. M5D2P9]